VFGGELGKFISVSRAIKFTFVLLIILVIAFIGYYAWDQQRPQTISATEKEEQSLEQFLKNNPHDPNAWAALGSNSLLQRKLDKAISAYENALNFYADKPTSYAAYVGLGTAYMEKGNAELAIDNFNRALALSKEMAVAPTRGSLATVHYYLGKVYLTKGELAPAEQELIESLSLNQTNADAIFFLGKVYEAQGNVTEAEAIYLQALSLVPNFTEVYSQLGNLYLSQGEQVKAAYNQAMANLFSGKVAEAVEQLKTVVASMTDNADAYWGLGWGYEKLNMRDEAIDAYRAAVAVNPGHRLAAGALTRLGAGKS
jgi:tetratricopeptide (TPR) repeat protein